MENRQLISLVYLTEVAPCSMATELALAGCSVWEALGVSEVLHLYEHQRIDAVVVSANVETNLSDIETRYTTIQLQPNATVADLMWELSQLFPEGNAAVH